MPNNKLAFYLFLLFVIASNHLCWGQSKRTDSCAGFVLNIIKKGGISDTVRLFYSDCSEKGCDTLLLVKGVVKWHGTVNRATEALLYTDIHYRYLDGPPVIRFIVEPGEITLSFNVVNDTVKNLKISGSIAQAEKDIWESANAALFDETYYNNLSKNCLKAIRDNNPALQKYYSDKIDTLYQQRIAAAIVYIKGNPNSYFSGYLLRKYKSRIPLDSSQIYYTSLTARVKQSDLGKDILSELYARSGDMDFRKHNGDPVLFSQLEKIKSLHDISLPDAAGRVHHLANLKGKYVVVDFWGSWCGPCFENIPYLKNLIAEMKGKPVEFVSISIDTNVDKWKSALAKHHFPGLNLVDTAGIAASYYKVPWVPKYVIINPDGSIAQDDAPYPITGELQPLLLSMITKKD